ncbi:MAG: hypothetical protein J6J91_05710 [Alistipes sp.]|nr:hypothetical protein [Alistipes sp.]
MKRFFRICLLALAIASVDAAQAQTKDFLQWFQTIKQRIERYSADEVEGAETMQFPAELLRTLTPESHHHDNNNLLGRVQVIYQMKFSLDKTTQKSLYDSVKRWATYTRPKIYESRMSISGSTTIDVLEATRRRPKDPAEFLVFISGRGKGVVYDIVGYITLSDITSMLAPELQRTEIDSPLQP